MGALTRRWIFAGLGAAAIVVAAALAFTLTKIAETRQPAPGHISARPPGPRRQAGYPGKADTGILPGLTLRRVPAQVSSGPGWRYDPHGWVDVYGDGAVLSNLSIPCNVNVTGSDVLIKNVKVVTGGQDAVGISLRHTRDVTIEDSVISGLNAGRGRMMTGVKDVFEDSEGIRILDNDISKFETGVQLDSGLVKGNYIHDPGYIAGDHTNGVMSNGGTSGMLTIDHNAILIDRSQTDAIGLFEDSGVQRNRLITNNLLAGGGYAIYAGQKIGGPPTSNIVIRGNLISTKYYPKGGLYGCVTQYNANGARNSWSMNEWKTAVVPSYSRCD